MIKTYLFNPETGLVINDKARKISPEDGIFWTDIENPDETELKVLEEVFGFHPLAIEDCIKKKQRAKLDDYRDYFFIVLHPVAGNTTPEKIRINELGIFVGHGYIVTFHWEKVEPVSIVLNSLEKKPELMAKGIDYVLYLIVDGVIDNYFPILDKIDENFSRIEDQLFKKPVNTEMNELFRLKRTLVEMRKVLSPHREMVNALIRYEGVFIKEENRLFYHDIYDHLMRIFDFLDTYRELLSSSQEVYLTVVSNRLNEVMKTLGVIATITLPLTLISSIYGMNFKYIPELDWRFGYLWALGLMATTAGSLVYYFRKKNWF